MKVLFTGGLLAVAVWGATTCPGKPDIAVLALFDQSESTGAAAQRERYAKDFQAIVEQAAAPAKPAQKTTLFVADGIGANSLSGSKVPVHECFPAYSMWTSNPRTYQQSLRKSAEQIRAGEQALLKGGARNTDILGALQLAQKVFAGEAQAAKSKDLVIFSDMIEESADYNFTRENLTDARIRRIIERERQKALLPKLTGVRVWVDGAGAGSKLGRQQLGRLERFWTEYFAACGAQLTPERYAATLMNFALYEP